MMVSSVAILTRSKTDNDAIRRLTDRSCDVLSLPAFELKTPKSLSTCRKTFASIERYDVVLFVSPAAVRFAKLLGFSPSENVFLAGPGAATNKAIVTFFPEARLIDNPADVAHSGSEALLEPILDARPKRVLIVRAQDGREWLSEVLSQKGIEVETLCVYERDERLWTEEERKTVAEMTEKFPILYVASSQAVEALCNEAEKAGVLSWLRQGVTLTIHPRCVEKLKAMGFSDVQMVASDPESVAQAIGKIVGTRAN